MTRSRIAIVGAGFAGFLAARGPVRHRAPREETEVVLLDPTDRVLCLPLLQQVAEGLSPDRRTVPWTGPEGDRAARRAAVRARGGRGHPRLPPAGTTGRRPARPERDTGPHHPKGEPPS